MLPSPGVRMLNIASISFLWRLGRVEAMVGRLWKGQSGTMVAGD